MIRLLAILFSALAFVATPSSAQLPGMQAYPLLNVCVSGGGNQSSGSIYELLQTMASWCAASPTAGGTLTVNSQSMGSYDYTVKDGNQTVSSFSNADWFTATADSRSALIVVKGSLTINSGQTFIPSARKLFTAIYVTGDCSIGGSVSMSARGANHSAATGSNITAVAIRIATGTFSGVTNPEVPAAGANGSTGISGTNSCAANASDGTNGQTGGGSAGCHDSTGSSLSVSGDGSAGTSFSGGTGGGAARQSLGDAGDGGIDGGAGGASFNSGTTLGGGAGNPGGVGSPASGNPGQSGTGGVLFLICAGELSGSGTIVAAGANGGGSDQEAGGSSGGGSITVMYGADTSTITPSAPGGVASGSSPAPGRGGNGTARKLEL